MTKIKPVKAVEDAEDEALHSEKSEFFLFSAGVGLHVGEKILMKNLRHVI